ncbi:hypothetical protein [Jeotgalibacillus haloalkalitolerans]|uniref:YgiT-type zinc finger domain-containing protein n=1 Tax=Jeotgalibacillus haloalkalitolerans TaxID=3104292 RepID=A0ABU5KN71_9BACL|nr:hypothetical protein [Jeotgalibacillus sp. HH7-29]MDZ5712615.1 hypothetical protein [Jeotgalibacillus sp. HH7-29]
MKCPKCGGRYIEDVTEKHEVTDDFITIQIDEIVRCEKCGYDITNQQLPRVIAKRDEDTLLIQVSQTHSRILSLRDNVMFPAMYTEALLVKGYWDDVEEEFDAKTLLDNARTNDF